MGTSADLRHEFPQIFKGCKSHYEVEALLLKDGILIEGVDFYDSESAAIYFNWETKEKALDFIARFNTYVSR